MKLPIDVHIIYQPSYSLDLFNECVASITEDVNVHVIYDVDGKSVIDNRIAGFSTGNSEWVSYIDYDDIIFENSFAKLLDFANANGHDAVFGNSIVERAGDKDIMFVKPKPKAMLMYGYTGVHQLYLVKRDIVEKSLQLAKNAVENPAIFDYALTCAIAMHTDWHFLNELTYRWRIRENSLHKAMSPVETMQARLKALTIMEDEFARGKNSTN
jgi:glycosyltransferase involved in cell wall biosynthesis